MVCQELQIVVHSRYSRPWRGFGEMLGRSAVEERLCTPEATTYDSRLYCPRIAGLRRISLSVDTREMSSRVEVPDFGEFETRLPCIHSVSGVLRSTDGQGMQTLVRGKMSTIYYRLNKYN